MKWLSASEADKNIFTIPETWLFIHYYEALNLLFRIENSLRIYVYAILKMNHKDGWVDLNITSDDSESGSIKSIAKKRIAYTQTYGYLCFPASCPIMYFTTGELLRIIYDSYWPIFKKHFKGSKEIMKFKLDEIGNIRNAIAHFRPIKPEDVEVLKQNARHTLGAVEECLHNILNLHTTLPTNTEDQWYKELSVLGTEQCRLSFNQSKDEEWVNIKIKFNCKVLSINRFGEKFASINALNLKSSAVLSEFPNLKCNLIYISEDLPFVYLSDLKDINMQKTISMLFHRKNISESYSEIKTDLESTLRIADETDLIIKDNLARGKFNETTNFWVRYEEDVKTFRAMGDPFGIPVKEDDPPEYWGEMPSPYTDCISGASKFPWMPIEISKKESP
jgi:hypothetical protein